MSNDTQHYTNFEIFHSLLPKMKAAFPNINNWDELDKKENYDGYRYVIDAIATAYRSGYGRGQKGRSFLIGEKKAEVKAVKGAKVCWFSNDHDSYYPSVVGTIGTINWVDDDGDLWVNWPFESCEANKNEDCDCVWCCAKKQCLLIDAKVKGNVKRGDKIVYLGTGHGFLCDGVWPDRVATGVVDNLECVGGGCVVRWDNPDVVGERFHGHTHVWFEDIAKVIPWD